MPRVGTWESIEAVAVDGRAKGGGRGLGIDLGTEIGDEGKRRLSFVSFSFDFSFLAFRIVDVRSAKAGDDVGLVDSESRDGLGGECG